MYQANDIEVFVFAHDRAAFLREALDCYLCQTISSFRLVVLANAPTEEVLLVLQEYALKGVEVVLESQSLNVYGCVRLCQELASRAITVMAHDDDWVHPAYLETLLKCYNQNPDIHLALSAMGKWDGNAFSEEYHSRTYLLNQSELSAYIFIGESFAFSSSSYKTKALKNAPAPDFARYGKVNDVPFMLGVVAAGTAAVLQFPFVKCRTHQAQDSRTFSTGPTAKQWIELDLCHKEMMSRGSAKMKWAYICNAFHRLKTGWQDWCKCEHYKMSFSQYLQLARQMGALDKERHFFGFLLRGSVRKSLLNVLCQFNKVTKLPLETIEKEKKA